MDEMTEHPVDLSPLDPRRDPERWERMVHGILARAAAPAAAVIRGPWMALAAWRRPALAAAAAVAAVSILALRLTSTPAPEPPTTVVEALDVPRPMSDWLVEGRGPGRQDVLVALDELQQ
jgi:anti-sigma-K factor RskA